MPDAVRRWAYLIIPAAEANGIPADMVAAVMTVESGGDPLALSAANAVGLMQVVGGPWDPAKNINVGTSMLAGYKREFHTWTLALAGYNAGPGAVQEYGGVPPYPETEDYVVSVQYLYDEYSHHPLTSSDRRRLTQALRGYRRHAPRVRHLRTRRSKHRQPPKGQIALPDGCDPSGGCRTTHAQMIVNDPFWPLGGSDPLPVVAPSSH